MYYFYILYSLKDHRLYKGSSEDFQKGLLDIIPEGIKVQHTENP